MPTTTPTAERELIVIARRSAGLRARAAALHSIASADVTPLASLLSASGASLRPLFGPTEEHLNLRRALGGAPAAPSDLDLYYRVRCADGAMDALASQLRASPLLAASYVKPAVSPASVPLNAMLPNAADAPPSTPDFSDRQLYLAAAPDGIDARLAWSLPGGGGAGVNIIDIEGAWRFTHEDLTQNQGGVAGGATLDDLLWRNHGTAVIGVLGADRSAQGVTGIAPDAFVRGISFGELGSAAAIRRAADLLTPGSLLLIELHRPGPGASGNGQDGYIPVEWWPDDYDAIRYAISRGVIVVAAAGNGARDLDAAIYDTPQAGFPESWSNPFRRGTRDSGAILVGAGAPPPGTHGRDWGPDRSRLDFSNHGSLVDAQGWGREVTSCGYGDLQGGVDHEDLWYTDQFSGTSSAAPIVVGALACVQGVLSARGLPLLTPERARALLRETGSAQQDAPGRPATQRIGARPDVKQMLAHVAPGRSVPLHRYWNEHLGDHFYTTRWDELGEGGNGWQYEGVLCQVFADPGPDLTPLHRYWNASLTDHFYTTNWAELGQGAHGWVYEGVQCYVHAAGAGADGAPLHRYWNPLIGDHFYTTRFEELGAGRFGWRYEGVQCYVETRASAPLPLVAAGPSFTSTAPESFRARPAAALRGQPARQGNGHGPL